MSDDSDRFKRERDPFHDARKASGGPDLIGPGGLDIRPEVKPAGPTDVYGYGSRPGAESLQPRRPQAEAIRGKDGLLYSSMGGLWGGCLPRSAWADLGCELDPDVKLYDPSEKRNTRHAALEKK